MSALDYAARRMARWRADPVYFVRSEFQVEPDLWQAEALRFCTSTERPDKRLSMQACVGPGKTGVLAWCGWLRLACYAEPGEHPKGYAIARDKNTLFDHLWPELAKWRKRSPFLMEAFEVTATRIYAKQHPEEWFLSARAWNKSATPEEQGVALSGLHSRFPFILVDESATIPVAVGNAAEQIFSNFRDGFIGQAGNPTSRLGMLYDACVTQRALWRVIEITGDPDDPRRSKRVDIEWARDKIRRYGRDSSWVMARVLGKFPPGGLNELLSIEEVQEAMARSHREEDIAFAARILGVDVARDGLAMSVIYPRQGKVAYMPSEASGLNSIQGAAAVARKWSEWGAHACFIDATGGFGGAWCDQLRAMHYAPMPVQYAGKPTDPRFANKRAEMYWRLREWVKDGGQLPRDDDLLAELSQLTYTIEKDKLLLEPKEELAERINRSPDHADALATTFAYDVPPPGLRMAPTNPADSVFVPRPASHTVLYEDPTAW